MHALQCDRGSHLYICCTLPDRVEKDSQAWGSLPAALMQEHCRQVVLLQFYAPLATKMEPVSRVKCCVGEGIRRKAGAFLYHKKVSAVELSPCVSGLTSTLTQATFSWLFHRDKHKRQGECLCKLMANIVQWRSDSAQLTLAVLRHFWHVSVTIHINR